MEIAADKAPHNEARSTFQHITSNLFAPLAYFSHGLHIGMGVGCEVFSRLGDSAYNKPGTSKAMKVAKVATGGAVALTSPIWGPVAGMVTGTAIGIEGLVENAYGLARGKPLHRPYLEQALLGGDVPNRERAVWALEERLNNLGDNEPIRSAFRAPAASGERFQYA